MAESQAVDFLMQDGNLDVPCGRYGHDTESCVPFALAVARIIADDDSEVLDADLLDHVMGLVVNSHDDVFTLIRDHGTDEERALIQDEIEREWLDDASEEGRRAARNAATWIEASPEGARRLLAMIEDGDPRVDEYLPRPNLSGEWAGDPSPWSLYYDITGTMADDAGEPDLIDALAQAWEEGRDEVLGDAIVTELRAAAGLSEAS